MSSEVRETDRRKERVQTRLHALKGAARLTSDYRPLVRASDTRDSMESFSDPERDEKCKDGSKRGMIETFGALRDVLLGDSDSGQKGRNISELFSTSSTRITHVLNNELDLVVVVS